MNMPTYKDTICNKCEKVYEKCDTQVICDKCIDNYEEQIKAFRELMELFNSLDNEWKIEGSAYYVSQEYAKIKNINAIIKKYL